MENDEPCIDSEKKIFLHVCCGPCAEWPLEYLHLENYQITAFFYNPNIHPVLENERRLEYAKKLMGLKKIQLIVKEEYLESLWLEEFASKEFSDRCSMCYLIRMAESAKNARENGFHLFTTSLLVSPYQNHQEIIRAGNIAAKKENIKFLPIDFRDGFRKGQMMAKEDELYRQKYCGCILSLQESKFKDKIEKEFREREFIANHAIKE